MSKSLFKLIGATGLIFSLMTRPFTGFGQTAPSLSSYYEQMQKAADQAAEDPGKWDSLTGDVILQVIAEGRYIVPASIAGAYVLVKLSQWVGHELDLLAEYKKRLAAGIDPQLAEKLRLAELELRQLAKSELSPALRYLQGEKPTVFAEVARTIDPETLKEVGTIAPSSKSSVQDALRSLEQTFERHFDELGPLLDKEAQRLGITRLNPPTVQEMISRIFSDDEAKFLRTKDAFSELTRLEKVALAARRAQSLKAEGGKIRKFSRGTTIVTLVSLSMVFLYAQLKQDEEAVKARALFKQEKDAPRPNKSKEFALLEASTVEMAYQKFQAIWTKTFPKPEDPQIPIALTEGEFEYRTIAHEFAQMDRELREELADGGVKSSSLVVDDEGHFAVVDSAEYIKLFIDRAFDLMADSPEAQGSEILFEDSKMIKESLVKTALSPVLPEPKIQSEQKPSNPVAEGGKSE